MPNLAEHRILAVDDEPDNLVLFKATLEMLYEAQVEIAPDAETALSLLDTYRPTYIVTDLSMPKTDGYALLRKLRARSDTQELPIVALTAHAMQGDKERVLEAGFDGYISKPFNVATLGDELLNCLGEYEHRRISAAK
ncbi:MAG: response regulator [Anaerolineae bacterium]|nr:response regulator [Anaerolineae bacterium]